MAEAERVSAGQLNVQAPATYSNPAAPSFDDGEEANTGAWSAAATPSSAKKWIILSVAALLLVGGVAVLGFLFRPLDHGQFREFEASREGRPELWETHRLARLFASPGEGGVTPPDMLAIRASFVSGCDAGDPLACMSAGRTHHWDFGVPREPALAAGLYQRACDMGEARGCVALASMLVGGTGLEVDYDRAKPLYVDACESQAPFGCRGAARMILHGQGGEPDRVRAYELYGLGCSGGDFASCAEYGFQLARDERNSEVERERGAALLEEYCGREDALACSSLASALTHGWGVEADQVRSAYLARQLCDAAYFRGCAVLGGLYHRGDGVEQDMHRAMQLYQQACEGGVMMGCMFAGDMYLGGQGVARDEAKALELYQEACEGGEPVSCYELAKIYDRGPQSLRNPQRAVQLYLQSCGAGEMRSCIKVAQAHASSDRGPRMVPHDAARATQFYERGCGLGDVWSCINWGIRLDRGQGTAANPAQAAELFTAACSRTGSEFRWMGCSALGTMYFRGNGVELNAERGRELMAQACDGGFLHACFLLGRRYLEPGGALGVDSSRGVELLSRACQGGVANACRELESLQQRARAWAESR